MNGFQIGSKRLKVQHKRVLGSQPSGGGGGHSPYGSSQGMQQSHHMSSHQGQGLYSSHGQQQMQPNYYRPAPIGGSNMMGGAQMLGQPGMHQQYGGMQGSLSHHQQPPQQMGQLGQYGMRAPLAGSRMAPQQASMGQGRGAGGGGYGYSYPTLSPYPAPVQQQQQRGAPGMQQQRADMYGQTGGLSQQQQGSSSMAYPSSDPHALPQSTHSAISYMDAGSGAGKPQQQTSNVNGFYGQY